LPGFLKFGYHLFLKNHSGSAPGPRSAFATRKNQAKNAQLALINEDKEQRKRLKQSHFCVVTPPAFALSFGQSLRLERFFLKEAKR